MGGVEAQRAQAVIAIVCFFFLTLVAWRFIPQEGKSLKTKEIRLGKSTLTLAVVSLSLASLIGLGDWPTPVLGWRLVLVVSLICVAVLAASDQWTRTPLRGLAGLGLLIVLGLLILAGQKELAAARADQAMAELKRVELAVDALEPNLNTRIADLPKQRQKALNDLKTAIDRFPEGDPLRPLADAADSVRRTLSDTDVTVSAQEEAKATFDLQYPPAVQTRATEQLGKAVDGALAAAAAALEPPSDTAVRESIVAACKTARPASTVSKLVCEEGAGNGEALAVQMAVVRLRMAEYRRDVLARDEDKTAVEEAEKALASARANDTATDPESVSVAKAVETGANAVFKSVVPGDPRVEVAWLGWLLIGLVALVAWRGVERRSARQQVGVVTLTFKSADPADDEKPKLNPEQAFRTAVLTNVSEPAAVPGSSRSSPVTDLVELVAASPAWFAKVVTALKAVLNEPHGYSIVAHEIPRDATDTEWRILVQIMDIATEGQVAIRTISGENRLAAARGAGFWAAATVLRRSTRVPSWASWSGESYQALATFESSKAGDITELREAVANAPTSGLLLQKLAYGLDQDSDHAEALGICARAVAAHPDYMVARYRMAVSVTILTLEPVEHWLSQDLDSRRRIGGDVVRACTAIGLPQPPSSEGLAKNEIPAGVNASPPLTTLALGLFDQLDHDFTRRQGLRRLWQRSQRRSLLRSLRDISDPYGAWTGGGKTARSARVVLDPSAVAEVSSMAEDPRSWWQLSYNLACHYARKGNAPEAVTWLETALNRPGSRQMAGPWLRTDPDLQSLHENARFKALVATLNPEPEAPTTVSLPSPGRGGFASWVRRSVIGIFQGG